MGALFSSGHIVDFILGVIVLEAVLLIGRYRATGLGLAPGEIIAGLIPGALLLLAVRTAITGTWWGWTAAVLAAAGVAHAADIALRLRGKR
jgi:hypothetical protein